MNAARPLQAGSLTSRSVSLRERSPGLQSVSNALATTPLFHDVFGLSAWAKAFEAFPLLAKADGLRETTRVEGASSPYAVALELDDDMILRISDSQFFERPGFANGWPNRHFDAPVLEHDHKEHSVRHNLCSWTYYLVQQKPDQPATPEDIERFAQHVQRTGIPGGLWNKTTHFIGLYEPNHFLNPAGLPDTVSVGGMKIALVNPDGIEWRKSRHIYQNNQ